DIDSLTKSMNYVPVDAGTNSTNFSGTKGEANQEVKKDVSSLRYIALPNWVHDALLESSSSKPQDESSTKVSKGSGNPNPTSSTSNPLADQMETLTVESPIPTPPGFQDPEFPVKVYKVEKAMYGLHQALRAWYGTLSKYLLMNGFQRGDILKKFRYSDVRSLNTPMDKVNPWGKEGTGKDGEYNTDFHPMVDFIAASPLRRARIAQSSALLTVADEHASLMRDVSKGEACSTDSGFIADQDKETIAKSSSLPHDSAPRAQEVEIYKLKDRVTVLEDREGVAATQYGDDAPIKGSIDEGKAATERISDDSEELARVLTSMDAATVLAGGIDDPIGSGFIPTAGPPVGDIPTSSNDVPTASPVFATATVVTPYLRRKGKEVMVESDTPKKQRDAEVSRIHAEEELQGMIDSLDRTNETIAKYIQEYQEFASELPLERRIEWISDLVKYQDNYAKTYDFRVNKESHGLRSKKRICIWLRSEVEDFIPMGSKEEAKRYKRKGIRFDRESSKKLKSSEEVIKDVKPTKEIPEEKMKEMIQLVPIKEVYVQPFKSNILSLTGSFTQRDRGATGRSSGWEAAQLVKENQEKDKIGSKPDKNGKRSEAQKSQSQLQSREKEKMKKIQVEGPKMQTPTKLLKEEERKGLFL
nr:uncharacterized mitochondrial protein AtMg00810-like [Tanacetum cinerariifolium]